MTFTVDMTLLAVFALIAGIAAFIAPRFLGLVAGVALILFGVFQLFPEVREVDFGRMISSIDLNDIQIRNPEPVDMDSGTRS